MKVMYMVKGALFVLCMAFALTLFLQIPSYAVTAENINSGVDASLKALRDVPGGADVIAKAKGVLVFPGVFKAAAGVGGEYGEGALRIKDKTVDYYKTFAVSLGVQAGAEKKSIIIAFMTDDALKNFTESKGWKIGTDASVAVITMGAGSQISSAVANKPIVAFVLNEKGLMLDVSLNGAKVTKIKR